MYTFFSKTLNGQGWLNRYLPLTVSKLRFEPLVAQKQDTKKLKSSSKLVVVPILLVVVMMSISLLSVAHATAVISTDQADYSPGSTVQISGSGFTPGLSVDVS